MMQDSFPDHSAQSIPKSGSITSIERQKKNPRRLSIFLDDQFAFGIHQDILLQHPIYIGLSLDESQSRELILADQLIRAKEAALSYLSHRARTEYEVLQKLRKGGYNKEVISEVIARLYELSYLDDEAFTKAYIRDKLKFKGFGPLKLKAELTRLGISSDKVEEALENNTSYQMILDKAKEQAQKYSKRLIREADPYKKRRKMSNFLLRKGHTYEVVQDVIEHLDL